MASEFAISTAMRNAMADAVGTTFDAGSSNAYIVIRSGSVPTNVSDADTGTLLGTCNMSDPSMNAAASGAASAKTISNATAVASDTAGYWRVYDSDDNSIMQGNCGLAGASPDMTFDDATIVSGGTIAITGFTVTVPISA